MNTVWVIVKNVRQSGNNKMPGLSAFWQMKKNQNLLKSTSLLKKNSNQTFTMFINPVKVWFKGVLPIVLTF